MSSSWPERFDAELRGPDKVVPLAQAVHSAVRPGMLLHFAFVHNRPSAAMAEIVRQLAGKRPRLAVAHLFTAGPAVALLSEGLVERLITTLICEPYPAPAPSQPARRAIANHDIALEHWSVLSYVARLRAAALGLPALPVRSLRGSTLAEENCDHVQERDDGSLEVRPLVPDLSFIHAPCADRFGNVLLAPPYGEGTWGALAARQGAVVTVERIVEPEVLQRHSHLVGLPPSHVRSVSVVPFGAHPAGLASAGIDGVEPYGDDVTFYREGRKAGRSADDWQRWVDHWLREPEDRDAYLAKLGGERLLWLKGKARADSWRPELLSAQAQTDLDPPANRSEAMICAAAELIASKVTAGGQRALLSGLGAGNFAAWLAHDQLSESGHPLALVAELGLFGYRPRPCDPFLFNFRNLATCTLRLDADAALGVMIGGAQARSLGSLGAGQVDACGRFNSTRLANGKLLVGSGGANDVASSAGEVVITMPAQPGRLVERVAYVTGPGERVTAVVTDHGIFEKPRGDGRLALTRLVGPLLGGSRDAHVRELAAKSEMRFEIPAEPELMPEIRPDQLARLRLYDPERFFLGPLEA